MITLPILERCLAAVPEDDAGPLLIPFGEGTCWACTITHDDKGFARHFWPRPRRGVGGRLYILPDHVRPGIAVEFGVNHKETTGQPEHHLGDGVSLHVAAHEPIRRRWYGAIHALEADRMDLVPCTDWQHALRIAPAYDGAGVSSSELRRFVEPVLSGDILALGILRDWLDEKGDHRGDLLFERICSTLAELFPETTGEPAKKGSLKVKAPVNKSPTSEEQS